MSSTTVTEIPNSTERGFGGEAAALIGPDVAKIGAVLKFFRVPGPAIKGEPVVAVGQFLAAIGPRAKEPGGEAGIVLKLDRHVARVGPVDVKCNFRPPQVIPRDAGTQHHGDD